MTTPPVVTTIPYDIELARQLWEPFFKVFGTNLSRETIEQMYVDQIPTDPDTVAVLQQKYWDSYLKNSGFPQEPPQHFQTCSLPKDPSGDFGPIQTSDRNAHAIFEAKQDWKRVGLRHIFCPLCDADFWGDARTKYCCDNHRKRHAEGKEICDRCGAYFIPPANKTWKRVRFVNGAYGTSGGSKYCRKCEVHQP